MDEDEAMTTTQDFTRLAQFAANPPGPLGWTAPIRRQAQAAFDLIESLKFDLAEARTDLSNAKSMIAAYEMGRAAQTTQPDDPFDLVPEAGQVYR